MSAGVFRPWLAPSPHPALAAPDVTECVLTPSGPGLRHARILHRASTGNPRRVGTSDELQTTSCLQRGEIPQGRIALALRFCWPYRAGSHNGTRCALVHADHPSIPLPKSTALLPSVRRHPVLPGMQIRIRLARFGRRHLPFYKLRVAWSNSRREGKFLESLGFKIKLGRFLSSKNSEEKAKDINEMFKDKNIKVIIASQGGETANALLSFLDYESIKHNPKIFIGISDITVLLNAINKKQD